MTTGTGLDAQLGFRLETTVGTEATVNKWVEFNSESLAFDPMWVEPNSLRVGSKYKRGSRLFQGGRQVSGGIEIPYATRNMGTLWKAAIGSTVTTPTLITGSAYKQIHQVGDLLGKSLTLQVGRPEPLSPYTTRAHTYRGCKVTGWEWSVGTNDVAKFSLEIDGWDESTATSLVAASFPGVGVEDFNFQQCTDFKLGATISGTSELTYASGTAVAAVVKSMSLKGDNALATERYGLGGGSTATKKEQLENGIPTITGTLEAEYSKAEFYDVFKAGTSTSLVVKFEGSVISGSDKNTVEFIIPQVFIKNATPAVSGPDVIMATVEFEVYQNITAQAPLQVVVISGDAAAI